MVYTYRNPRYHFREKQTDTKAFIVETCFKYVFKDRCDSKLPKYPLV